MPRMRSETISGGDMSWLGSAHAITNARTETVNIGAFTAGTHYPDGYIKSGTPVAKVAGLLVPYDVAAGTTTGAGILAGFILTDQPVVAGSGNFAAPVLDHGRVKTARVPYASFAAPSAAKNSTTIVFI